MVSVSWRKNLYAIFVAEFVVLSGFSFASPFMALYIQQLGNFTNQESAFWAGIATGCSGIAMFLSSPLWGIIADRWGRKPMVLRAMFGSAIVIALNGIAPNIYCLVALRFAQGLLSGTIAAASALVGASTPRDKMPFAMGLIALALYGGTTIGPLIGGVIADAVGYQAAFFITGAILFSGGLIVIFFVKEKFVRPVHSQGNSLVNTLKLAKSKEILPLLLVLCTLHLGPSMILPMIPLFIRQLNAEGTIATSAGLAFCFMGIISAVSAAIAGRIGGRISLKKMLVFSCIITGLLYLPPMWAGTVTQLVIFIALTGLLQGGIMTSSQALVGLSASGSQQGVIYGLAQSANAIGAGIGPLLGGSLASGLGLKPIFGVAAGIYIVVGIFIKKILTGNLYRDISLKEEI
ncbi:MAG: MFS transporter, partial [Dehalococcoidales bacterium]|nr:MFS transporter [Dehalococcoidales bacterium]